MEPSLKRNNSRLWTRSSRATWTKSPNASVLPSSDRTAGKARVTPSGKRTATGSLQAVAESQRKKPSPRRADRRNRIRHRLSGSTRRINPPRDIGIYIARYRLLRGGRSLGARGNVPVALDRHPAIRGRQPVSARKLADAADDRMGLGNEVELQRARHGELELVRHGRVGQHRAQLGAEDQPSPRHCVIQPLLAGGIPRQEELLPMLIPNRQHEDPAEQGETLVTELLPGVGDDLGIPGRHELMTSAYQLVADAGEVVDHAVEDDVHRAILVGNRPVALLAGSSEPPGHAEPEAVFDVVSPRVATQVLQ